MQVKKFEAPTLQEALDTIKRELGPEAIILQTKQNRRGFGLMSKGSVEVTAAVSERASVKKVEAEKRIPEGYKQKLANAPANRQADLYDSYLEKRVERERVQLSRDANAGSLKKITAVRYADIEDDGEASGHDAPEASGSPVVPDSVRVPEFAAPASVGTAIDQYAGGSARSIDAIQEELSNLKRLVEELRKEKKRPDYIDSDSPYAATDALEEAYDLLVQSGVERRFAVQIMRETARNLGIEARADHSQVLDHVAAQILRRVRVSGFFGSPAEKKPENPSEIHAFVGAGGTGKTALIAKLGTHASRSRQEKIGFIRVQLDSEEAGDPLSILAKALHVPYRSVSGSEELQVAIQDLSRCDRVFVDTPGIQCRDAATLRKLGALLSTIGGLNVNLVLNASTRDAELRENAKSFLPLNPSALMFTRLDETFGLGCIFSVSQHLGVPVSVFSNGRRVTEQWENATGERLAASILNIL
jgi:flagellar biosynthesis protein FlhF